jgi:hypothetical protein
LIGAIQILPGEAFAAQSQRVGSTYGLFVSGSLPKRLIVLAVDPFLLGTAHARPLAYLGSMSLPDISSYLGILPVMAVCGLLARRHLRSADARQWRVWYGILVVGLLLAFGQFTPLGHLFDHLPFFNRQRSLNRNLLEVDLALAVLFATWVDRVFGPAAAGIALLDDLSNEQNPLLEPPSVPSLPAGAIVHAEDKEDPTVEVHAFTLPVASPPALGEGSAPLAAATGSRIRRMLPAELVLTLAPVLLLVVLQAWLWLAGRSLLVWFGAHGSLHPGSLAALSWVVFIGSALGVFSGLLFICRRATLLASKALTVCLVLLVVANLVYFNILIQRLLPTSANAAPSSLVADLNAAQVGDDAGELRTAFFDPDGYQPGTQRAVGQADLNILDHLSSVQGEGALVDDSYAEATATDRTATLAPRALENGTFDQLNLGILVTPPEYFLHLLIPPTSTGSSSPAGRQEVPSAGSTPLPPGPPNPPAVPASAALVVARSGSDTLVPASPALPRTPAADYDVVAHPPSTRVVSSGTLTTEFFGTTLAVTQVTVPVAATESTLQVGLLLPSGQTAWIGLPVLVTSGQVLDAAVPEPVNAVGLAFRTGNPPSIVAGSATSTVAIGFAAINTAGQGTYRVDGSLLDDVTEPHWRYSGSVDGFGVFENLTPQGQVWIEADGSRATATASARVLSSNSSGTETISVSSPSSALLIRSVADAPGWEATVRSPGGLGAQREEPVQGYGLVEAVTVPAGQSVITFSYHPPGLSAGALESGLGILLVMVLLVWPRIRRRVRSGSGVLDQTDAANRPVVVR